MLMRKFSFILAYLYLKIINISCVEGSTLAFAIDDTRSMWDDIIQVKQGAKDIMKVVLTEKSSEIKDFVLVTINDPDVVFRVKTTSPSVFQEYLNSIQVHNHRNRDCAEMSLTGIEKALTESRPGSYIYVFTDAAAKDHHKVQIIKNLCEKKQSQVVFVLTGHCGNPSNRNYMVYHEIAAACAGQVFPIAKNQVQSVLETIKIMMKGKHSIVKWKILPVKTDYYPVEFTIDEKVEYAIVSTSGNSVQLWVTASKNMSAHIPNSKKITWNSNAKVLKINNLIPGTYYAWVKGNTATSVVIYLRTDFTFEHGFSTLTPTSISDTSKQPKAYEEQYLAINITDPEHSVAIKSVQIIDMNENVMKEMTLKKTNDNFYITDAFVSPSQMFKIKVKGVIITTSQPITRISKTAIEPKFPTPEPPAIINDGNVFFGVEGDTVLKIPCNVTGFPDPVIVWKREGKVIKNSPKYYTKGNILYVNNPKMKADTGKVTCEAQNKLGTAKKTFEIDVTDSFYNGENFDGDTHPIYIHETKSSNYKIKCRIVNSETSSVRWYRNGEKTNQTGIAYIIERPSVSDDGNYTCRVNTNDGPKSETYAVDVGFPPTFENNSPSVQTVDWHGDEVLDCSEQSKPVAKIEWRRNGKSIESLNNEHEINAMEWGEYTCTVSNNHGTIQRSFKVITSGCYLRHHMTTQNMPLLSQVGTPSMPDSISNSDIELKKYDKVKFSCPATKKSANTFQMIPSKTELIAECDTEDKFIVEGKTYIYRDLQCKTKVEPTVIDTREQCSGPNTEMLRIGFAVNGFLDAYQVCYDKNKNVPVYASALKTLSKEGNGVDPSKFKWSSTMGLRNGKPSGGYTCGISKKCCYEKGQLVNVDDLAFGPTQLATFEEHINSIAVWIPCDKHQRTSWQDFEKEIRAISYMADTWSSWTGASNYVNKNGGLIPRYLWKVMNYDGKSSAMVYVNDESPVASDIKCIKPCTSMMENTDKFLYCCSLVEFSEVFGIALKNKDKE